MFSCTVCVTGQHREMIEPLLDFFDLHPDHDLNIMTHNQTLQQVTMNVLKKLDTIMEAEKPDYVFVQGDTTTAMAAGLAAFYRHVRIAHVEAGLRTWNKNHPYPEEVNRRVIDSMSDLYFAHTERARQNLLGEGVAKSRIEVTGNTVIDSLLDVAAREFDPRGTVLENLPANRGKMILVTAHRRENHGGPLLEVCNAIREIASRYRGHVWFAYPVHLNPNVQQVVYPLLGGIDNICLIPPLDYVPFVHLMKKAFLILTDSGGIQEEAPSLGKPVLVLRETTERPEAVEAGTVAMVGTCREKIVAETARLLDDWEVYGRMSKAVNPYGDGKASERIVHRMLKEAERHG
ncbi:MAG: UDP-N-acetylglucosamine 2-epimerase [Syntrophorhabdaceae bacterium PtaU1.Bin034]|nr:MAG: UDP-N-acetylglucosamine 2-epimerase [Syntrophorhabdaceae bacterium PtaU1.Bin034]